jgi:hypothetical protein
MGSDRQAIRRVDVHLAAETSPVSVTTVTNRRRPLPGIEAALFVHEGDLLTRLQEMRQQGPRRSSGSLSEELEGMYQGGYQAALADVGDLLRKRGDGV